MNGYNPQDFSYFHRGENLVQQFITPIACVMLAALTSCSNDKVLSEATPKDRIDVSTAFGGVKTKAVSNDDELQNTSFVENELINVYLKEHGDGTLANFADIYVFQKSRTTLVNGANMQIYNSPNAYYPLSGKAVDAYAFYPAIQGNVNYNILDKMSDQTFTVLADQSIAENYRKCDLMFGSNKYYVEEGIVKEYEGDAFTGTSKAQNPVKLIFKHQLSKIIVKIQPGGGLIESNLTDATITMFGPKPDVKITTNSTGITLGVAEGTAPEKGYKLGTYSSDGNAAIVIPQKIDADTKFIKITLSSTYGSKTYTYKLSSQTTFESGKSYTYTLKLTSGGLDVTTQIGDWGKETGDGDGTANIE